MRKVQAAHQGGGWAHQRKSLPCRSEDTNSTMAQKGYVHYPFQYFLLLTSSFLINNFRLGYFSFPMSTWIFLITNMTACYAHSKLRHLQALTAFPLTCYGILCTLKHPHCVNCSTILYLLVVSLLNGRLPMWPLFSSLETRVWFGAIDLFCSFLFPLRSWNASFIHRGLWHPINNTILSPRQYGFRLESSIQEAFLTATHEWQSCLDHGLSTATLFLDMSKAFDKVPHHRILLSLASVGVSGTLLKWFEIYLSNHTQRVVLSGHSSSLPIKSGVPQGRHARWPSSGGSGPHFDQPTLILWSKICISINGVTLILKWFIPYTLH